MNLVNERPQGPSPKKKVKFSSIGVNFSLATLDFELMIILIK